FNSREASGKTSGAASPTRTAASAICSRPVMFWSRASTGSPLTRAHTFAAWARNASIRASRSCLRFAFQRRAITSRCCSVPSATPPTEEADLIAFGLPEFSRMSASEAPPAEPVHPLCFLTYNCAATHAGLSLHANVRIHANDRQGLEQLCLCAARGAISLESPRAEAGWEAFLPDAAPGTGWFDASCPDATGPPQ